MNRSRAKNSVVQNVFNNIVKKIAKNITKNAIAVSGFTFLLSQSVWAAPDARTAPEHYFLTFEQVADSLSLLPDPPRLDSIDFMRDKAYYDAGKALRNTPRGKQAYFDGDSKKHSVSDNFSAAFGFEISPDTTPETFLLISTMKEDAGDLATRRAKKFHHRARPFAFYQEATCRPEDQAELSTNGSYPSGHTAIGWAIALVLVEVNPARQNEILKRGYEIGESRVICGYHWQSDIEAARVVASGVVATLHSEPRFLAQLEKAKKEVQQLSQKTALRKPMLLSEKTLSPAKKQWMKTSN